MQSTLRKVLLVGIAASAIVTWIGPVANAAGGDTIEHGCFFDTNEQATVTGGANVGVIGDASITQDASALPIDATVSCQIQVNGVVAPNTTFSYSGAGVQAGVDRVSYAAGDTDWVQLCQRVLYADGTDTGWVCPGPEHCFIEGPPCFPPAVNTLLDLVNGVLNEAFTTIVDPQLCPVLVANAGTYGPVTIQSDGDVYVSDPFGLLGLVYDCPPYGDF
jgi:hypothetical protein